MQGEGRNISQGEVNLIAIGNRELSNQKTGVAETGYPGSPSGVRVAFSHLKSWLCPLLPFTPSHFLH